MEFKGQSEVRGPKSEVILGLRPGACFWLRTPHLGLRTFFAVTVLLAASMARADNARQPTLEVLGNEVQCTCGCVAPLNQCPHFDCAEKAQIQGFIKQEIAGGKDEATILHDLSVRYGMQILSAPPARGFNLAAWVLPGIGLLVGLGLVVVIVRSWRRKTAASPVADTAPLDPKVMTAMEEEMKSTGLR